eukprot:Nk52_evm14s2367 gene=Nk52_evmTU14s2367
MGISLLVALSLLTNYTGRLLATCLERYPGLSTYPDIGQAAFGDRGRIFVSVVFYGELFCASGMFLILMADNLHSLYPSVSVREFALLACLIVMPTTWTKNLSILSYTSMLGLFSSLFLMMVILFEGFVSPGGPEGGSVLHPAEGELVADANRLPMSVGLFMVGFAGHACFPSIYTSMRNRKQYNTMVNTSYCVVFSVYLLIAVCGYLMYGVMTSKEITLDLLVTGNKALIKSATWLIIINPATKFAITINPIALSIEELFMDRIRGNWKTAASVIVRTGLTLFSGMAAVNTPYFARVTGFIGAVFSFLVIQ